MALAEYNFAEFPASFGQNPSLKHRGASRALGGLEKMVNAVPVHRIS
jgi:hypothetical protein